MLSLINLPSIIADIRSAL